MESNPIANAIITMIGANPIKVLTPWVVQISPKMKVSIGIKRYSLLSVFLETAPIKDCNAPLIVIILKEAPENKITNINVAALLNPSKPILNIFKGFTGLFSI